MDEVINNYCIVIKRICDGVYNKAIRTPKKKFDWNDNAYVWYGYLVKEGELVLNKMEIELTSKKFKALARQLQKIVEKEFEKLKLCIEGEQTILLK